VTSDPVLLLCWGNPARQDDGLGIAFAEACRQADLPGVVLEVDYQPNVEQAAELARCRYAVCVDAAVSGREPFGFWPLRPRGAAMTFSTHRVEPEFLLAMAASCFGRAPEAYSLGIRGYRFGRFEEGLSARARDNLAAALAFLLPVIETRSFAQAAAELQAAAPDGGERWKTGST